MDDRDEDDREDDRHDHEDERLVEVVIDRIDPDDPNESDWEGCPCCETFNLARMVAHFVGAICWIVFCVDCGKYLQKRWNLLGD